MCSGRHGEGRVRSTTPAEDRYIVPSAKSEQAHHSSAGGKSVSLLPQESRSPEKLLPDVRGEEDYTHADLLCVPLDQTALVLPVCNGVVSITIELNRTGHAYYSQMRVGSVCHRIVDAN
ncbi:hypothetical protein TNCV_3012621 [Trichonephila clavipes]|nr:hypothetical protein TNCV_3012621 [Trichonephila clavipes]